MELKDLNDTIAAHDIIDFAFRLQTDEVAIRIRAEPNALHPRTALLEFIPTATEQYLKIRAGIKSALAEK